MEALNVFKMLSAGGDVATIAILFILVKHHTRLTIIETKLKGALQ